MVKFIAGILEQLDLALEHVSKQEVHNARFSLMMTDNALELVLHQIAKDKDRELRSWPRKLDEYPHKAALAVALGQHFDAKVRFAKIDGLLDNENSRTVLSLHNFRNQLYHEGLQHEEILPNLAAFYLDTACRLIAEYRIRGLSYGTNTRIPDRAKKYILLSEGTGRLGPSFSDLSEGCRKISSDLYFNPGEMIASLCDHLEQVIGEFDICLQIAADGVYEGQKATRDKTMIDCQIWPLLFSEEGKRFAIENRWSGSTMGELEAWMGDRYPLVWKRDPVPFWKKRVDRMRTSGNPHSSLANYLRFMEETESARSSVMDAAAAAEREIDRLIDERRGN